jgi:MGT family glycosyltransferase
MSMANVFVYTSPARGHLFPIVPTMLELRARGHRVHVRTLSGDVERLVELGLEASPMAHAVEAREIDDHAASSPPDALDRTLATWLERAKHEIPDVREGLASSKADVALIDVNSWGALAAAEASGIPFAIFAPYFLPLAVPGRPTFGLGLAPSRSVFGRMRDALLWSAIRWMTRKRLRGLDALRAELGLPAIRSLDKLTSRAARVLSYTAEPFEYDHGNWPANVRFVGPGIWEPAIEAAVPASDRPLVLVTCSTEFQGDAKLLETALAALDGADVDVVATSAAIDPARFRAPANARVVRFAAHGPLLRRAVAVVCHGGMGITQKALAAGVPVCVVPWGRDQSDVGRHVEVARAGVVLPKSKLSVDRMRTAIRETRERKAGAERIAAAFAASGGARAAADVVEEIVPRAPVSSEPPARALLPLAAMMLALLVGCGGGGDGRRDAGGRTDAGEEAIDAGEQGIDAGPMSDAGAPLEANIREVLDCGAPIGVTGVGQPGELQLREIDTARFPDALCNDGTPAVVRFRPHRGDENRNRWVISIRGGGFCANAEQCAARWCSCAGGATDRCPFTEVETRFTLNNMSGGGSRSEDTGGILRRDATAPNPLEDYNHVELVYCSSDAWTGQVRAVTYTTAHPRTGEQVSYTLHFLGARILEAGLDTLRQDGAPALTYTLDSGSVPMPDLDDAEQVLIAGDSAGGAGVITHLDHVREVLEENHAGAGTPEVVGLIDAVTGPDWSRLDWSASIGAPQGIDTYDEVVGAIAGGPVSSLGWRDESCVRWHAENEPETADRCVDETHVLRHHVTTPFFVRMALFDGLVASSYEDAGVADPELGPFVTTEVAPGVFLPVTFARVLQRELQDFPLLPSTAEEGAEMSRAPGVFAPACTKHDTIHTDSEVYGVTITPPGGSAMRLLDVLGNWNRGADPSAVLTMDEMREDTVCP